MSLSTWPLPFLRPCGVDAPRGPPLIPHPSKGERGNLQANRQARDPVDIRGEHSQKLSPQLRRKSQQY